MADQGSRQYRYQHDSNNRLTQLTDPVGTLITDFAYDAQGRQIRKGTQTRTFDGANRITAINGETYAYDGSGRRIATWAADGRTKVEVYTQSGKLGFAVDSKKGGGSSFVYLAGQRIAEDHWNCGTNTHTATYFHADALGSPVATTDAARNVLERTYYAPYGEALNRTVDGPGYTGHVMDAATGLVYAQQRYYDPLVGKFLSIDPVAANPNTGGNFNRYWYANNNPYKFTDPDGRCPTGSRIRTCVESSVAATTTKTINVSSEQAAAAKAQGSVVKRRSGDKREKIGSINRQKDGSLKVEATTAVTGQTKTANTATGNLPSNAEVVIHGHLDDGGLKDDSSGLGDAGTIVNNGKPNIAVGTDGRQAAHEVENGKYQIRALIGTFKNDEIKQFKLETNARQGVINESLEEDN